MTLTAQRTEKRKHIKGNGLESTVEFFAIVILLFGIVAAIGFLATFQFWGLIASVTTMFSSLLQWLLLRCLAEHLRLQKKIAGCNFDGEISGQIQVTVWACGNCGRILYSDDHCEECGAQIVSSES